jgi:hypothetical protein
LRESAAALPPKDATLLARWVPEPVVVDGRLDEPAWARAPGQALGRDSGGPREAIELRELSDGRRLVIGLRDPAPSGAVRTLVTLGSEKGEFVTVVPPLSDEETEEARMASSRRGAVEEVEIVFERGLLHGDPYPTRRFTFQVHRLGQGDGARFPASTSQDPSPGGALLVVR